LTGYKIAFHSLFVYNSTIRQAYILISCKLILIQIAYVLIERNYADKLLKLILQVYKGLNIATAKASTEEQSQAPHHLLDITTPNEPFTVTHFRDLALPIVSIFPCLTSSPSLTLV
jgi:hypothetical protein